MTQETLAGETLADGSTEDTSSEGQTDANDQQASDGDTDGSKNVVSLEDLGKAMGSEFKDVESALKSVKETKSYVGKKKEDVKEEVKQEVSNDKTAQEVAELRKQLDDSTFYNKNSEYEPYKDLIAKFGDNPSEVVKQDDFKNVYAPLKAHAESQNSKSILHSNPKLGKVTDKMGDAKKAVDESINALHKGDVTGSDRLVDQAKGAAISAVLDAYEQ